MSSEINERKNHFIDNLKIKINLLKKNNRLLSLKHAELKFWYDCVQISTIVLSTMLTFIESVKTQLDLESSSYIITKTIFSMIPIFFSTVIALSISILKFKKYTEQIEDIVKLSEKHIFVLNKFRRIEEEVVDVFEPKKFNNIKENYSKEPLEAFMDAKVTFDKIMKYQEIIYYGNKYNKLYKKWYIISNKEKFYHDNNNKLKEDESYCSYFFKKILCFCFRKVKKNDTEDEIEMEIKNNNIQEEYNNDENESNDEKKIIDINDEK